METKAFISEEEYLSTSFDGVQPEYYDGELIGRPIPNEFHSATAGQIIYVFASLRFAGLGKYRIPDIAVYITPPTEPIRTEAPFIAVEVISPDNRYRELFEKYREYRQRGIRQIWAVDPELRSGSVYEEGVLREVTVFEIQEYDVCIPIADFWV